MNPCSHLLLVLLSILAVVPLAACSQLEFRATPSAIHPILTTTFQLRCSLQTYPWVKDVASPQVTSNPFMKYVTYDNYYTTPYYYNWQNTDISTPDYYNGQSTQTTPASAVNADVAHITSILITKVTNFGRREAVASVTLFDPPTADGYYASQAQVEGSCERSPFNGEKGYLLVTWTRPLQEQAGEYLCEISGLSSDKHPVTLQSNVQISFSQPTVSDLIGYISNNEMRISQLEKENNLLKQEVLTLNTSAPVSSVGNIKAQHIQQGSGECNYYSSYHWVNFYPPYTITTTPIVFLSVTNWTTSGYSARARVTAHSINNNGFNLECDVYDATLQYEWLAIDN
ncbi:DSC-2 [Biomphalaria pfeifferi]|uniref:DSC-2 n=1 Tax=Biomphalaria pfeifferi TaxID=112525 RepID=A0AAD8ASW6_BIOPF|nr:DSC-2 [Biomphalaria pfeifferi]